MTLPTRFLPEAQAEYESSAEWYEQQRDGLGADFVARVEYVIDRIAATPTAHGKARGDVRKAVVSRFPYIVLYRVDPGEVVVVSVFHTSRDPADWQSRV